MAGATFGVTNSQVVWETILLVLAADIDAGSLKSTIWKLSSLVVSCGLEVCRDRFVGEKVFQAPKSLL